MSLIVTFFGQICNALTYLHDQNLVHGLVSSHAIQLVASHFAKLGNFEYTIDRSIAFVHCLTALLIFTGMKLSHPYCSCSQPPRST